MKVLKLYVILFFVISSFYSCKRDDDTVMLVPDRDRNEQQIVDDSTLVSYLMSHYYNSDFIESLSNPSIEDIEIIELGAGETTPPEGHTILFNSPNLETKFVDYLGVNYKYYILRLNQGVGIAPRFTDAVRVRYEGVSVSNNEVFDVISTPEDLLLQGDETFTFGTIKGWQFALPTFNTGIITGSNNGIIEYENYGFGVIFIPSGLGYFSNSIATGTSYDNLIFKFELLQYDEIDHDNDGIPSYVENIDSFGTSDNDFDVFDDDTDNDGVADFVDFDDDGDGVATFNELISTVYEDIEPDLEENEYVIDRETVNGVLTITTVKALDTDNNGVLDYLDADISINYNEDNNN